MTDKPASARNMVADPIDTLFRKHDELRGEMAQQQRNYDLLGSKVDRIERDIDDSRTEGAKRHGEVMAAMTSVSKDVADLKQSYHYQKGARDAKKWLVPVTIAALSVAVGVLGLMLALGGT